MRNEWTRSCEVEGFTVSGAGLSNAVIIAVGFLLLAGFLVGKPEGRRRLEDGIRMALRVTGCGRGVGVESPGSG
jgi:hypothetical protein